ncbi:hypothetical protein N183_37155 [Sinorhizobium sp. Sb3]|nr:hypothetical protein N183_37155 [Sinorhizobium sp. Sb3]
MLAQVFAIGKQRSDSGFGIAVMPSERRRDFDWFDFGLGRRHDSSSTTVQAVIRSSSVRLIGAHIAVECSYYVLAVTGVNGACRQACYGP